MSMRAMMMTTALTLPQLPWPWPQRPPRPRLCKAFASPPPPPRLPFSASAPLSPPLSLLNDPEHEHDPSSPILSCAGTSALASRRSSISAGEYNYATSVSSSDIPYDAVGERGPGNPLFPSNFASLALGPTLRAKCVLTVCVWVCGGADPMCLVCSNPALRWPTAPPPRAFGNPHAIRMNAHGRKGPGSWAEGWDPMKHEYAVFVASGSSVGP